MPLRCAPKFQPSAHPFANSLRTSFPRLCAHVNFFSAVKLIFPLRLKKSILHRTIYSSSAHSIFTFPPQKQLFFCSDENFFIKHLHNSNLFPKFAADNAFGHQKITNSLIPLSSMSTVKYRVKEYTPTALNQGSHSVYAEIVINNEINNTELAKKIAARTGFKSYECQGIISAIAEIVFEETLESNKVTLSDESGVRFLSIFPRVQGSVSDLDVERETTAKHAEDPSIAVRTVATESDLTPSRLSWNIAANVGVKYSKRFAMEKQAQKVKTTLVEVPDNENLGGGDDNGNDGPPPEGGGFGG